MSRNRALAFRTEWVDPRFDSERRWSKMREASGGELHFETSAHVAHIINSAHATLADKNNQIIAPFSYLVPRIQPKGQLRLTEPLGVPLETLVGNWTQTASSSTRQLASCKCEVCTTERPVYSALLAF
jgi:hypothetical protein